MRILLALCFIFCTLYPHAQKETSHWFMNNNHVTLTPTGVVPLTPGAISNDFNPYYASTSVSDAQGQLLFACSGSKIIDRNHAIMPALRSNSLQFLGDKILTIKVPGSSKYYLFYNRPTSYERNMAWTLSYAIIDLSLNGGTGDVVTYNQDLATNLSKGFTLAKGAQGEDAWLVTHRKSSDIFLTYKIDVNGLSSSPVISKAGLQTHTESAIFLDLETSPNGKLIAGIAKYQASDLFATLYGYVEAFHFDAAAGKLTNKIRSSVRFEYFSTWKTIAFSPDNRLLYAGDMLRIDGLQPCGFGSGTVQQYNLCYTDSLLFTHYSMRVANQFLFCAPNVSWGRIQTALDKRIHMPYPGGKVSVIAAPNRLGSSSDFRFDGYQLPNNNYQTVVTPTYYHKEVEKAIKNNIVYDGCYPAPLRFSITNDTIHRIDWDFGDPAGTGNRVTALHPQHAFSSPGTYTVTARLYGTDGNLIETLTELVEAKDPEVRILEGYPKDTTFCAGGAIRIKLNVINGIYHWYQRSPYDGSPISRNTTDSMELAATGTYYVEMRQNDCNGCIMLDSITLTVLPKPYVNLGPDRVLCAGDSTRLYASYQAAVHTWSTGATANSTWVKEPGTYWLRSEIDNNGCPVSDTIVINQAPGVSFSLPADTVLCNDQSLLLAPGVPNASYYWQDGSRQGSFTVRSPGKYWVRVVSTNGCQLSDTIQVAYISATGVNLGRDTILCNGSSLSLKASIPGATYAWSNGASTEGITVTESGRYWVQVNNGSCVVSDTILVTFQQPPVLSLGGNRTVCDGELTVLRPNIPGARYTWQDGSTADSFRVRQSGQYYVKAVSGACEVSDTVRLSFIPSPPLTLGRDTTVCAGSELLLNVSHPSIRSYQWQDGSRQPGYTVRQPGQYAVTVQGHNGCASTASVRVLHQALPAFSLGQDTSLCEEQSLSYRFNLPQATYRWNNGSQAPQQSIHAAGLYWLEVMQNNCTLRDSIIVQYRSLPVIHLGNDTSLCEGTQKILDASFPLATYQWQDGSSASQLSVNNPGLYHVNIQRDGCLFRDSIRIEYLSKPRIILGGDTTICTGQELVLNPKVNQASLVWGDGSTGTMLRVTNPGMYTVTATNKCGSSSGQIQLTRGVCKLYMPNAFTPNGDGINDLFRVKYPGFIKTFHMAIYNRWGAIVFQTENPLDGWNGRYRNTDQPAGNYIWQISLTTLEGEKEQARGNVILLR